MILFVYPSVIGLLSFWLFFKIKSKYIWAIPLSFILLKQIIMCFIYAIQTGSIKYLYLYGASTILLYETIANIILSYIVFSLTVLFSVILAKIKNK